MLKSKLMCREEYKGLIDGEVKHIKAGEEFLCDPSLAYRLLTHYPRHFEAIGSENVSKKKKKKEKKEKKNYLEYSNKMEDLYDEK